MSQTEIAVAQGVTAQGFQVLDHRGLGANSYNICNSLVSRGFLVEYDTNAGEVKATTSGGGASINYAGFIDQNVIAYNAQLRVDYHGENAIISKDFVAVWNEGRFRITAVEGLVGDNVPVYPGANGTLKALQSGTDKAVGICRKGNGSTSGGSIEVEINFIGR